jgi:hypothetical protein
MKPSKDIGKVLKAVQFDPLIAVYGVHTLVVCVVAASKGQSILQFALIGPKSIS